MLNKYSRVNKVINSVLILKFSVLDYVCDVRSICIFINFQCNAKIRK